MLLTHFGGGSYLDLLEAESALAHVVGCHQWVVYHETRLHEEVVFCVIILVCVRLVALIARPLAADCVLAEVELCVVANELEECLSQVNLGF